MKPEGQLTHKQKFIVELARLFGAIADSENAVEKNKLMQSVVDLYDNHVTELLGGKNGITINPQEIDLIVQLLEASYLRSKDENLFKIIAILIKSQQK